MVMVDVRPFDEGSELVLGLVAPVGANLDGIQPILEDRFKHFNYETNLIRLSHLLRELELETVLTESPPAERYQRYMDAGTEARRISRHGDFLALSAAYQIQQKRTNEEDGSKPLRRTAHVLRSLKHPDEVHTLRRIYGDGFFLLGIHAPREIRLKYLTNDKNISKSDAEALIERDEDEDDRFGQRTRDAFELCDAFVSLHAQDYKEQIWRLLDLLFGNPHITPTADEHAMFLAYGASLRSADLSRQVGAVIVSPGGEVIATGANDVPKFGGGLYFSDDEKDARDWQRGFDSNEAERDKIAGKIVKEFDGVPSDDAPLTEESRQKLKGTGLFDITEYGRAVHAEMEALLSCTRTGISPRGGALYATTFPCHNCGKHIVASGIERVVYVEPYPKSRALELHDDSITMTGEDGKVKFEPFVGIGPRRFIDLFSMRLSSGRRIKRKRQGKNVEWNRKDASLRVPMAPHSYLDRERLASRELDQLTMETNHAS
ncbi:MAG: deaminase [Proteobacteria bacterium]|nr:deaminase [Pseudomonadota bacterium]